MSEKRIDQAIAALTRDKTAAALSEKQVFQAQRKYYDLTNSNMYTQALRVIAMLVGMKKEAAILTLIDKIHDLEGSMPEYLSVYRRYINRRVDKVVAKTRLADGRMLSAMGIPFNY